MNISKRPLVKTHITNWNPQRPKEILKCKLAEQKYDPLEPAQVSRQKGILTP